VSIDPDSYIYELGQDEVGSHATTTIGQFRTLVKQCGWSEDWLVEQCKEHMDYPREIIREILHGSGMTKPWPMGTREKPGRVSLTDTPLVWWPLLNLYRTRTATCGCGCGKPLQRRQRYATPACRRRASRI
jgi:hypothetical protein